MSARHRNGMTATASLISATTLSRHYSTCLRVATIANYARVFLAASAWGMIVLHERAKVDIDLRQKAAFGDSFSDKLDEAISQ